MRRFIKRPSTRFFVSPWGWCRSCPAFCCWRSISSSSPIASAPFAWDAPRCPKSIAASTSTFASQADIARMQAMLNFLVERNQDLLSAAVRKADGAVVAQAGDHRTTGKTSPGSFSIDSQVQVPILAGQKDWGRLELRFKPLLAAGLARLSSRIRASSWSRSCRCAASLRSTSIWAGCCVSSTRRVQCPARVAHALDTMAEGLLVIDLKGYIMLANQAFAEVVGKTAEKLTGGRTSEFAWLASDGQASHAMPSIRGTGHCANSSRNATSAFAWSIGPGNCAPFR